MLANRYKLIQWQRQKWFDPREALRLHLGSGFLNLKGYVNIDVATDEADMKTSIVDLPFEDESADEIICQHVLEHIPTQLVDTVISEMYRVLQVGGTVEIGVPDMDLCCWEFLSETDEDTKNNLIMSTFFGCQDDGSGEVDMAQAHNSGFTLDTLIRKFEQHGFAMIEAYNYDGYNTPSAFLYARKKPIVKQRLWEQDVVMGVFTHRTTYLPKLWESINKHLPQIPFITKHHYGKINEGMASLRHEFIKSGKRFWIFLDDDIIFLNSDIVNNAVRNMVANKYAAMNVYSTFSPACFNAPYERISYGLEVKETPWAVGYFILVDSTLVGDIVPDLMLPDGNTSVDTSYSVEIKSKGYKIGLSSDMVYHAYKDVKVDWNIVNKTNEYLKGKWGQYYYDNTGYGGNVIEWRV